VKEPPPVGIVAHDGVSRLDQQETQEWVALLDDVPEALPAASRFPARNQSQIAAYLLATWKALRNPENQDKGQCRDGANPRMLSSAVAPLAVVPRLPWQSSGVQLI
jgi:hypothetical protein